MPNLTTWGGDLSSLLCEHSSTHCNKQGMPSSTSTYNLLQNKGTKETNELNMKECNAITRQCRSNRKEPPSAKIQVRQQQIK